MISDELSPSENGGDCDLAICRLRKSNVGIRKFQLSRVGCGQRRTAVTALCPRAGNQYRGSIRGMKFAQAAGVRRPDRERVRKRRK
jgi:hypothetical protein